MSKIFKRMLALVLAGAMIMGLGTVAFAEDAASGSTEDEVTVDEGDKPYIALGADLTADQRATVLSLFGITEADLANYDVVTVTNAQEHQYLDAYMDSSTIGTRALSSVLVMEADKGSGITVTTKNISYCTVGMYENALATAGVTDAEVIVAGPSSISGTAALIGAIEAYAVMTDTTVDPDIVDGAVNEIVTTGAIEESTGASDEVEGMIAYLKEQLADSKDMSDAELEAEIESAAEQFDVDLTQDDIDMLIELLHKLQGMDLDWDNIAAQAQKVYDKLKDLGLDLSNIDTDELVAEASGFFAKIMTFLRNLFNR